MLKADVEYVVKWKGRRKCLKRDEGEVEKSTSK